jgi:protein-L-isoaspartate(D-aspartate) O-methyltransferase
MDFSVARHNMVENQIRTNKVTDSRILDAIETVPRERFVPDALKGIAYLDGDIELGAGRRLLEPMVFARMLQAAEIQPNEVVLDVGCGTGYSAAVLAHLASTVVALESDRALMHRASALLGELGVDTVALIEGALAMGDQAHGPYDAIIVEGAVGRIPDALTAQLAEGGRLVAVISRPGAVSQACLSLKVGNSISTLPLFEASAALLPGFAEHRGFVF